MRAFGSSKKASHGAAWSTAHQKLSGKIYTQLAAGNDSQQVNSFLFLHGKPCGMAATEFMSLPVCATKALYRSTESWLFLVSKFGGET
jgi:hypothetical protein